MSDNVQLPALGESVTEGTVTRWLKNVGDTVEVDEPLLEISTDKVDTEIPSPFAGVLEQILVQEDETVEVGATLAVIGSGEGSSSQDEAPRRRTGRARPPPQEADRPSRLRPRSPPPRPLPPSSRSSSTRSPPPRAGRRRAGWRPARTSRSPRWASPSPRAPSPAGSRPSATTVAVDEPLLEISTDKVDTEIPSPFAGTLQQILVQEDETVEVGAVLAVIGSGSAPAAAAAPRRRHPPGEGARAGSGAGDDARAADRAGAGRRAGVGRGHPRAGPGDADACTGPRDARPGCAARCVAVGPAPT